MRKQLKQLRKALNEVADLNNAIAVLGWDQETYMPGGAVADRSCQLSTLSRVAHLKATSSRIGKLLDFLEPKADHLEPDSDDARLLKVAGRNFRKMVKVPAAFVAEMTKTASEAQHAWAEARERSDFPRFLPWLERIVAMKRRYAEFFAPFDHIYDPLLDDYEPGLKTADLKAVFDTLRGPQADLVKKIAARPQVDSSFLTKNYPKLAQLKFAEQVVGELGFDWGHGRQDLSAHPFTTNFGIGDVRITTRVMKDYLPCCLFGSIHESGHAMYEQGVDWALSRTPLACGASLGVHESQSRLWENLVGRSREFWEHFLPKLQAAFPEQLAGIGLDEFHRGINRVEPSLIRVEADEATYNLHIMLRFELELELLEGKVEVKDLPELWRERMRNYLGVVPKTDADGVLQDIHWSMGSIGYFPTYALGNLISAQLWEKVNQDIPGLPRQFAQGDFSGLLGWLRQNVHRHGAKFEPMELLRQVTGSGLDAAPYLRYLENKYAEIYGF